MSSIQEEIENDEYIQQTLNPLLEPLILEILLRKPSRNEIISYMTSWLQNEGHSIIEDLIKLSEKKVTEHSFSQDNETLDNFEEELQQKKQKNQFTRFSVSAEVYGNFNKLDQNFTPPVIQKSQKQLQQLKSYMEKSLLFVNVDDHERNIVADAFEIKQFEQGVKVIQQNDDGDYFYIVNQGTLSCFKDGELVKTYNEGDTFGELALLYNAPRAASIQTETSCILYALERQTFNQIVKNATIQKRQKYEKFLETVDLLQSMSYEERSKVADVLIPVKFQDNQYVVKEGEKGDHFYFIESGEAIATKTLQEGKAPSIVYTYKAGDYFGELSLLKNSLRAANIVAKGQLKVVSIDRDSFRRILGPLDEILKRNFSRYEKYMQ